MESSILFSQNLKRYFIFSSIFIFLYSSTSHAIFDEIRRGNLVEICDAISKISESEINQLFTEINTQEMIDNQLPGFEYKDRSPIGEFKKVTPLHLACLYGIYPAIEQLLKKGINPRALTSNGWAASNFVTWGKDKNIEKTLKLLSEYKSNVNHLVKFLMHSIENKNDSNSSFSSNLEEKDFVNVQKLIESTKQGHTPNIKKFIDQKTHLKDKSGSALYWAIKNAYFEIVRLLLEDKKTKLSPRHFFAAGLIGYNEKPDEHLSFDMYALLIFYSMETETNVPHGPADLNITTYLKEPNFDEIQNYFKMHNVKILASYYWQAGHIRYIKSFKEAQKFYYFLKSQSKHKLD